jgi:lysozyme family protein
MDALFLDYAIKTLLPEEGGATYTNDPTDKGGATKYGITEALARAHGYTGSMENLSQDQAVQIYYAFMWQQPGWDKIAAMTGASSLALELLDLGVNTGPGRPGQWLQRGLNLLVDGKPLTVDGQCGAVTRFALQGFITQRGSEGIRVLCALIRAFAGVFYVQDAEADPTQRKYEFGWLSKRAFPAQT